LTRCHRLRFRHRAALTKKRLAIPCGPDIVMSTKIKRTPAAPSLKTWRARRNWN
jgi:hypothetical protein